MVPAGRRRRPLVVSVLLHARIEAERRRARRAIAGIGLGLGALLFAGTLDDRHDTWWPGLIGGIALRRRSRSAGARSLFAPRPRAPRRRGRRGAAVYAEARGARARRPRDPGSRRVSLVALGFLVWLLHRRRRREGEKYAGLRILLT